MTPNVSALPDECRAAIAALEPFASHAAAVAAINHGLRKRYMDKLYRHAASYGLSDPLVQSIGAAINLACDRAVALTLPAGGGGCPIDCLSEAERAALGTYPKGKP